MPLTSKILFGLSILAMLITAVFVIINWVKYKKELKEYRFQLSKVELQEAKKVRKAKEEEVIRRFKEQQEAMMQSGELTLAN